MFTNNEEVANAIEKVAQQSFEAGKAVTNAKWYALIAIGTLGYWYYKKVYLKKQEENKEEEI